MLQIQLCTQREPPRVLWLEGARDTRGIPPELVGLVRKTLGLSQVLHRALSPLADRIEWAFIFGSLANGKASEGSDVDLLVVGDLEYDELSLALYPAQEAIGREINPKLYRPAEWSALSKSGDGFVQIVLSSPQLDLIGESQ